MRPTGHLALLLAVLAAGRGAAADRLEETWCVEFNSPVKGYSEGRAIAAAGAGNVAILGSVYSAETHYDYLTIEYDPDGKLLWMARYDGNQNQERPAAIAGASDGSVYVTGSSVAVLRGEFTDFATVKYDSLGREVWVARYDNPDRWYDNAVDIGLDSAGNIIVAGDTYREATQADFLTIKYDAAGNQLWASTLGGTRNDHAYALAVDPAGNSYVTGTLDSKATTVKYDPGGREVWVARSDEPIHGSDIGIDGAGNVYVSASRSGESRSIGVFKYDPAGKALWAAGGPEIGPFQGVTMAVDAAGGVFVAPDMWEGFGTGDQFLVCKYDTEGTLSWEARRPGSGSTGLALDGAGGVLASGWTYGRALDCAVTKYEAATGNVIWDRTYDEPGSGDVQLSNSAAALAVLPSGAAVVTGTLVDDCYACSDATVSCGTVAYDADGNLLWAATDAGLGNRGDRCAGFVLEPRGGMYCFGGSQDDTGRPGFVTMKYDGDGKQLWLVRETEDGNFCYASAAASDPPGNICVTGSAGDPGGRSRFLTVKYDPEGRSVWRAYYEGGDACQPRALAIGRDGAVLVTGTLSGASGVGGATVKYDADGKRLWAAQMGSDEMGDPEALAVDAFGNVVVIGWAHSAASQGSDFATLKYGPDGRLLWEARYHGPAYHHLASAVAAGASGSIIVAGVISTTSGPPEVDCAIVKYDPDGRELWSRLEPAQEAAPVALALDAAGNAHIAGGGGIVAKYDPEGNLLWSAEREDASLATIALGPLGEVFAGGSFFNVSHPPSESRYESLLLLFDPTGNPVGEASHPMPLDWQFLATGLAVGSSGDVYLAGTRELTPSVGDIVLLKYATAPGQERQFIRGDCDGDGKLGIGDVIFHLEASFRTGRALPCDEACDTNGDGRAIAQVADPVYALYYLFLGERAPPPPFPACGPGQDTVLSCKDFPACP